MSPALADLPVRKVTQALESVGFSYVRTKGSHAVYRNREGRVAVIPKHGVVKRGTRAWPRGLYGATPGNVPRSGPPCRTAFSPQGGVAPRMPTHRRRRRHTTRYPVVLRRLPHPATG